MEWITEKRKVKDLIPNLANPRKMGKNEARKLVESLEKFNYVELVAIQPDNRIIAGHMRVKILKQIGRGNEEIEVRVPNRFLTDGEMREYLIRSNKNTGEWDWDILANEFSPTELFEWGFTEEELVGNIIDEGPEEEKKEESSEEKCVYCGQKIKNKKDK